MGPTTLDLSPEFRAPKLPFWLNSSLSHTSDITRAILQGEMGLTSALSDQFILASFGAERSVIVAMFNPTKKMIGLSHIDRATDVGKTVARMKYQLQKEGTETLNVYLSTGCSTENQTLLDLQKIIRNLSQLNLVPILGSSSLVINAKTGEISTGCLPASMDWGKDISGRMKFRGLNVRQDIFSKRLRPAQIVFNDLDLSSTGKASEAACVAVTREDTASASCGALDGSLPKPISTKLEAACLTTPFLSAAACSLWRSSLTHNPQTQHAMDKLYGLTIIPE
jgi:hypothetical protein